MGISILGGVDSEVESSKWKQYKQLYLFRKSIPGCDMDGDSVEITIRKREIPA